MLFRTAATALSMLHNAKLIRLDFVRDEFLSNSHGWLTKMGLLSRTSFLCFEVTTNPATCPLVLRVLCTWKAKPKMNPILNMTHSFSAHHDWLSSNQFKLDGHLWTNLEADIGNQKKPSSRNITTGHLFKHKVCLPVAWVWHRLCPRHLPSQPCHT